MWRLFLLVIWLLWENWHHRNYRKRVRKWKGQKRLSAQIRDAWNRDHQAIVPQLTLHLQLAQGLESYESGAVSVLQPHYKPVACYGLLRGVHEVAYQIARWYGWRCTSRQGVWFWERGTGPVLLFLHGFGFGPYAYGRVLQELSKSYHVIAPQYPGLSYDGRDDIPLIQDYTRTVCNYLDQQKYSILSNSFGTVVHHALLRELGSRAAQQVVQQIYVEPVCFYPYAGQLFTFVELTWRKCLAAPTWHARMVTLLSYLLIAKDCNNLYICQQILEDPKWDGEVALATIPSTIILSEHDSLIRVPELQEYLLQHYPQCQVLQVKGAYHGEALFTRKLKIPALLFASSNK